MARHRIPTAEYRNFTDYESARQYVKSISYRVVIKASGLAAGKGVIISETLEETLEALKDIMLDRKFGDAGAEVVIEEFLEGDELSILTFSDGHNFKSLPPPRITRGSLMETLAPILEEWAATLQLKLRPNLCWKESASAF